jgi:hypothetical protein
MVRGVVSATGVISLGSFPQPGDGLAADTSSLKPKTSSATLRRFIVSMNVVTDNKIDEDDEKEV